jgi:predicted O-linked N-acetylglucosamine transferase (SPINDLY family)
MDPASATDAFETAVRLHQSGRVDEAEAIYRRTLDVQPDHPRAHQLLGVLCSQTGRYREALELLERAVALNPQSAAAHCNLGMVLTMLSRNSQAIRELRTALAIHPDFPEAWANLANAYRGIGEIDAAIDSAQRALMLRPSAKAASHHLTLLHLHPSCDARQLFHFHTAWRKTYADPLKHLIRPHTNDPIPARRLRVGYVTPELSDTPVVWFLLPLLQAHNHAQFEIFCYSDSICLDTFADQVQALCDEHRLTVNLTDQQMADLVRQDQIDILVDLAMHSNNNRLLVFAQKPAPIQVTYLAWGGTTGLDTIDYRFTDPYLDAPGLDPSTSSGQRESVYSEKSVRLRSFWCYRAPPQAPPVDSLPAASAHRITFGCLNSYAKVTRPTLDLWAEILQQVTDSRLMIHCPDGEPHDRTTSHLGEHGIDAGRIVFVPPLALADYYRQYNQIDIGLDPFPWPGGTTTCDALWMGVPVITLTGKTAVSRGGSSILSNVGLPELIATTPRQYVGLATELAGNTARLAELRASLRERMLGSPLMDAPSFAAEVESAYRSMWRVWCSSDRA